MNDYGIAIFNYEEYILQSYAEYNGENYEAYATKSGSTYKLIWADEDSFYDGEPPVDVLLIDICSEPIE